MSFNDACCLKRNNQPTIEQQLAQAHREGWEQAKAEAVAMINDTDLEWRWSIAEFIVATMEYKGESK